MLIIAIDLGKFNSVACLYSLGRATESGSDRSNYSYRCAKAKPNKKHCGRKECQKLLKIHTCPAKDFIVVCDNPTRKTGILKTGHMQSEWVHHFVIWRF